MRCRPIAEREAQEDKQQTFNRHAGALRFLKNASAAPIAAPTRSDPHRMA
jgi:hypothetical protein